MKIPIAKYENVLETFLYNYNNLTALLLVCLRNVSGSQVAYVCFESGNAVWLYLNARPKSMQQFLIVCKCECWK